MIHYQKMCEIYISGDNLCREFFSWETQLRSSEELYSVEKRIYSKSHFTTIVSVSRLLQVLCENSGKTWCKIQMGLSVLNCTEVEGGKLKKMSI